MQNLIKNPITIMGTDSDDDDSPSDRKRKHAKASGNSEEDKYKMYFKTNYTRLFLENNNNSEYTVYVENKEKEKIGNKNPIKLTNLFTENVKGITSVYRVNAYKIGVTFKTAASANSFLKLDSFLQKNKLRAFIPAHKVEKVGVIRYVPTDMSNEEIYRNISCDADVISVKRFMRRDAEKTLVPTTTIAITFSTSVLPMHVYLKLYRYEVTEYVPPLIQCYKCFKFNHSAKVCRGSQMCSCCAGNHFYKECDSKTIKCINCGGDHLAISRDCPIKQKKLQEKRNSMVSKNRTFASVANLKLDDKSFPPLNSSKQTPVKIVNSKTPIDRKTEVSEIVNNEILINAIVKSLVHLGNSKIVGNKSEPITINKIKEILLSNLV